MDAPRESPGPTLVSIPDNPVPEGAHVGHFRTSDGITLRYARFARTAGPVRGTVCLVGGRTEFIEKYFETIADFQRRGFVVATFDWRGQGGSERLIGNRRLGYVDRFEDYLTDLTSFHSEILLPDCPAPFFLVGHSMGGLISLMAGTRDRLMFERMFLSAPMVGLDRQPFPMRTMARIARGLSFVGLGHLPVARHNSRLMSEEGFPGNPLTGDRRRYVRAISVLKAEPKLAIGAPTFQWFAAAAAAMATAQGDRFPLAVQIPVLILAAACDRVVSTAATEQLGLRMRAGRHVVVAGAQHELFMETDPIRAQVLAAFDAFITERSG
jgi:lysophospholipase